MDKQLKSEDNFYYQCVLIIRFLEFYFKAVHRVKFKHFIKSVITFFKSNVKSELVFYKGLRESLNVLVFPYINNTNNSNNLT